MKNIRVAKRYALALFASAKETNVLDAVKNDLSLILEHMDKAHDFRAVLRSPVIQGWRKKTIMREIFGSQVQTITLAFFDVLCDKGREDIVSDIIEQYEVLYNKHNSLMPVSVTSAVELSAAAKDALNLRLQEQFAMKPLTEYRVNPAIKGGLMVQIGDTLLDTSLRAQLQRMHDSLLTGGSL